VLKKVICLSFAILAGSCEFALAQGFGICDPPPPETPHELCDPTDGEILIEYVFEFHSGQLTLQWEQEGGFDSFNLYRGRLRSLSDADHSGVLDSYGGCIVEGTLTTQRNDESVPPLGDAFIYIATGIGTSGESGFGVASNGVVRPNAASCASTAGKPFIEEIEVIGAETEAEAVCDFTEPFKDLLCAIDVSPNQFVPFSIFLTVWHSGVRLEAHVLDPDSTPTLNDIASVNSQWPRVVPGGLIWQLDDLLDDGAANVSQQAQWGELREACFPGPVCPSCSYATYPITSNDLVAGDDLFTTTFAFVTDTIRLDAPLGVSPGATTRLAWDCIQQQMHSFPWSLGQTAGTNVEVQVEAVDRSGFAAAWPSPLSIPLRQTHFACSGDECACCLMLSTSAVQCVDRPGLVGVPGSGFENGFCVDML